MSATVVMVGSSGDANEANRDAPSAAQRSVSRTPPELMRIRSPLARAMYHRLRHQQEHSNSSHIEWYVVDRTRLSETLCDSFVELRQDAETSRFLEQCFAKSDWLPTQLYHSVAKSLLTWFMSSTSANGLLQRGSMFVLSADQLAQLLDGRLATDPATSSNATLLDLGAGDGEVTHQLALGRFQQVFTTEASTVMQWRLRRRGYRVLPIETWAAPEDARRYDLIAALNLLDRCDKPVELLRQMRAKLRPVTGRALVAVVLPFSQYVEHAADHQPSQRLRLTATGFEAQAQALTEALLRPAGFEVEAWSRAPYLCEGDLHQSFYVLADAVFLLRPV